MIKVRLLTLFACTFYALGIFAQDSLIVYIINNQDTSNHIFRKYDESSSMVIKRKTEVMKFSEETRLQLFDTYGNLIQSIKSDQLDLTNKQKGFYYINFYNIKEENWLTVKLLVK
jgi:hypothetical protein